MEIAIIVLFLLLIVGTILSTRKIMTRSKYLSIWDEYLAREFRFREPWAYPHDCTPSENYNSSRQTTVDIGILLKKKSGDPEVLLHDILRHAPSCRETEVEFEAVGFMNPDPVYDSLHYSISYPDPSHLKKVLGGLKGSPTNK